MLYGSARQGYRIENNRNLGLTTKQWVLLSFFLMAALVATTTGIVYVRGSTSGRLAKQVHKVTSAAALSDICASIRDRQGPRYLVTGAAGFIGSAASRALRERGNTVVGIDNFNDYYPVSLKRARARVLLGLGVPVVEADLNDSEVLPELFRLCSFTHVLHLAAQAGVRYAARNPSSYVHSNIAGSVALMEVMRLQRPMPILVYASSSSVYGLSRDFPFSEADRADRPASLYAATKRSLELLAHSYFNIYRMSVTGLRFFTVYGPWGRPDMSVMAFSRNIVDGKPIRVFQGENATELARDFTFIDDIVAGILGALDSTPPSVTPQALYRIFNLGNTRVVTVTEMVTILQELLGVKAKLQYVPLPATGDVLKTNANITEARNAFDYSPKVDIKQGLRAFVTWFYEYYGPDGKDRQIDEVAYVPD